MPFVSAHRCTFVEIAHTYREHRSQNEDSMADTQQITTDCSQPIIHLRQGKVSARMWFCCLQKRTRNSGRDLRQNVLAGLICLIAWQAGETRALFAQANSQRRVTNAVSLPYAVPSDPQTPQETSTAQFKTLPSTQTGPHLLGTESSRRPVTRRNFEYESAMVAPNRGSFSRFVSPFQTRVPRSELNSGKPPTRYATRPQDPRLSSRNGWTEQNNSAAPITEFPMDQVPLPPGNHTETSSRKAMDEAALPSVDRGEMPNREISSRKAFDGNGLNSILSPNLSLSPNLTAPINELQTDQSSRISRRNSSPIRSTDIANGTGSPKQPQFDDLPPINDEQNGVPIDNGRSGQLSGPFSGNENRQIDDAPSMDIMPGFNPANRSQNDAFNDVENKQLPPAEIYRPLPAETDNSFGPVNQGLNNGPEFVPSERQSLPNNGGFQPIPNNEVGAPEFPMDAPLMESFENQMPQESFQQVETVIDRQQVIDHAPSIPVGQPPQATGVRSGSVYENLPVRDAPKLWWDDQVLTPQSNPDQFWSVGVNDLLAYFLKNSPRVRAIRLLRDSSQPAVMESHAEFDPATYVETNFTRLNDPVGNELTTGGADRFKDDNWVSRAGLRQKMRAGGTWEAYQQLGTQTNNSDFFVPSQQGNAYLSLSFTQPLLNGRGKLYNESLIAIANLEIGLADGSAAEQIQQELLGITEKYWNLYTYRSIWFQRQENVRRAEKVYQELERRADIDVSKTQLFRAKAALATRKAALVEAYNNVRNVEVELAACLGIDARNQNFEFVPNLKPVLIFPKLDVRDAFVTALENRPEVIQAGKKVQIASEKANRSRHELKPVLDLLVSTYVSGLNDKFEFLNAFGRQFSDGAPGYSAGLNFEMPLHRRAARARLERDELRWNAITSDLEDEILKVQSEVDIAVRYVDISYRKLLARETAMQSALAELQAQQERMDLSVDEDNLGLGLNLLLDSQDRLADQENQLARAQTDYMMSWVALKKAMGTLVLVE